MGDGESETGAVDDGKIKERRTLAADAHETPMK